MKTLGLCLVPPLLGLVLAGARGGGACAERAGPGEDFELLFFATLEGLYQDGVSNEIVDALLARDASGQAQMFVPGCPICIPVRNAFEVYRARPEITGFKARFDTFGDGLAPELAERCLDPYLDARLAALHELVERWVDARFDALRLSEAERDDWRGRLEGMRKKGTLSLRSYQRDGAYAGLKNCAVCDGANEALGAR